MQSSLPPPLSPQPEKSCPQSLPACLAWWTVYLAFSRASSDTRCNIDGQPLCCTSCTEYHCCCCNAANAGQTLLWRSTGSSAVSSTSWAPVSALFAVEPSLATLRWNIKYNVHMVMCAPSDRIRVCLSRPHVVSALLRLQQEA